MGTVFADVQVLMGEHMEAKEDENNIRMMSLSHSFSRDKLIYYRSLRIINSLLIASSTMYYVHFYLIRSDDDKSHSYFSGKSTIKQSSKQYTFWSKQRRFLDKLTMASLIVSITSNFTLKLKKHSLTKLLRLIKYSHSTKKK